MEQGALGFDKLLFHPSLATLTYCYAGGVGEGWEGRYEGKVQCYTFKRAPGSDVRTMVTKHEWFGHFNRVF